MTWDKKKIEDTLISLSERINKGGPKASIDALIYDSHILLSALNLIDEKSYEYFKKLVPEFNQTTFSENFSDFRESSFESIINKKDSLFDLACLSEKYRYARTKLFIKRLMSEDLYLEFIRAFLKDFNPVLYELFLSLADGNIHFACANEDLENARGACYYPITIREPYLVTDFKRRIAIETLPHEIGHADEFLSIGDFDVNIQWHLSTFCEAYPTFMGLAFLEYVIANFPDDAYYDFFLEQKRNFFDSLKATSEYYLTRIDKITSFDLDLNSLLYGDKKQIHMSSISRHISDFLAIYMLHLYKTDRVALTDFLAKYHAVAGKSDEAIWKLIDIEELKEAFLIESCAFNREAILSRKKNKKSNTFKWF